MLTCDRTDTYIEKTNKCFIRRWNTQKQSKVIEMVGRLHADICNASTYIVRGVTVNLRLKKGRREFYLIAKYPDSKVTFKILEVRLLVRHIELSVVILYAHNKSLEARALAKYHLTRIEVKTFRFSAWSQSLSIDNAVLGHLPKRLLFTLVKKENFSAHSTRIRTTSDIMVFARLNCTLKVDGFLGKAYVSTLGMIKLQ
jgi:hypothetical protein